jgi:hypothetical protein
MNPPIKILATKKVKAGKLLLIIVDGKKKWVWGKQVVKPVTGINEFLSR